MIGAHGAQEEHIGARPRDWHARLDASLGVRAGRTRITALSHEGPLRVQRVFHPEPDGTAHLYVLHPPAGVAPGDRLRVSLRAEPGASVLVTTPGAGKLHRSDGREASVDIALEVAAGATLEHVPQETIVFDGAIAALRTRIELAGESRYLGWDVLCLGRPACGERLTRGRVSSALEVRVDGTLVFVERARYEGGGALLEGAWGLGGRSSLGTLIATHAALDAIREALTPSPDVLVAATQLGSLCVVRALGEDTGRVRAALGRARHAVRREWQRAPIDPAIWRT